MVRLSLRMLFRDWRAGELRVLAAALALSVAGIAAVGFFADRIEGSLEREAGAVLGADLAISSGHLLSPEAEEAASAAGLRRAHTIDLLSMGRVDGAMGLVSVRAGDGAYPLRGFIRVRDAPFEPERAALTGPEPGNVWVETRLLGLLRAAPGDTLFLGDLGLRITGILASEPLAGSEVRFGAAPRVMLNMADLPATGLMQPGSRVRHRHLFAGDRAALARFQDVVEPGLRAGERLETAEETHPQLRLAIDRARRFLSLAALTAVLLSGVAVAVAARRFVRRRLDAIAVMRCLGARQGEVLRLHVLQLGWLALGAIPIGILAGYLAQFGLAATMAAVIDARLPPPTAWPAALGGATAVVTLLGFGLPPLLHVRNVPALRVLRREVGAPSRAGSLTHVAGAGAILGLMLWYSADVRLGLQLALGAAGGIGLLAGMGLGLLGVLRLAQPAIGPRWRPGIRGLLSDPGNTIIQVVAFGLGISVLLVLLVVRTDLLAAWQEALPEDAPNRFLMNVQPDQVAPLEAFFEAHGREVPTFSPMVRGRIVEIAGRPVAAEAYDDERTQNLLRRDLNLSWAARPPVHNRVTAGQFWDSAVTGQAEVSVEESIAEALGITLGDEVVFEVAGRRVAVAVTSLRRVVWDSFHVNFFMLMPPGVIDDQPATWITSLHVPTSEEVVLEQLVRAFPNVTVLDVAAIMAHMRTIIDRVTGAIEYVFLFTLAAGLLVMHAAIQATLDRRLREVAILRTLGGARAQLLRVLAAEFATLGLLAGLAGATVAGATGWGISRWVLDLPYVPGPSLWLIGGLAGAVGVGAAGVAGTRAVLRVSPLEALQIAR